MLSVPANEVGDIVEANPESESGEVYDQFSPEWHSIWIDDLGGKEMVGCFGEPGRQERFSVRGKRDCFESYAPNLFPTFPKQRICGSRFTACTHQHVPCIRYSATSQLLKVLFNLKRSDRGLKRVT